MTRREAKQARVIADRKALYAKFIKPAKVVTVFSLVAAFFLTGPVGAMAATPSPSIGSAVSVSQMASPAYENITGVSGTAADGVNFDVDMSDASTVLTPNMTADNGNGGYSVDIFANGTGAGDWNNTLGSSYSDVSNGIPFTSTVTGVNGNVISLDVVFESVPNTSPNFTASGSSTGPAPVVPVAPKTDPTAATDSVVLDTTQQASVTADVLANDTPSPGYILDPSTLMLTDPMTGALTTSQNGNATLTVVNGKVVVTAISNWSGFAQANYTAKEIWAGVGTEPAGYQAGTVSGQLKVQVIGAEPVQTSPTDCTVPAAPSGGTGFSVPFASVGSDGLTCNLVAAADTVNIAPDATQATVNNTANDTTTNSSYTIDPQSIQFRAPDGTFAKDVTYPGQFSLSYDATTGITTTTRIGTYSGTPSVLYRVSESKLDDGGNKLVGGSSSALLSMNFAAVTTPEKPVTVPETPVTVPETPVTVPVVPAPVGDSANTPVTPSGDSDSARRLFALAGDTSAAIPVSKAVSVTPKGNDNNGILAAELALIAIGTAVGIVIKARHRKIQKSDVRA